MTAERIPLPDAITAQHLVVVARGHGPLALQEAVPVLAKHGLWVIEVTLDSPDALTSIGRLAATDGITVGAGTVLRPEDAVAAIEAGARFVVSPTLELEVLRTVQDHHVPYVPGTFTPSEASRAWTKGASAAKVFPAAALGSEYVRALAGPLGHIPLIPTGGIAGEEVLQYLDAGAVAVGLGGWLPLDDLPELARKCELLERQLHGRGPGPRRTMQGNHRPQPRRKR